MSLTYLFLNAGQVQWTFLIPIRRSGENYPFKLRDGGKEKFMIYMQRIHNQHLVQILQWPEDNVRESRLMSNPSRLLMNITNTSLKFRTGLFTHLRSRDGWSLMGITNTSLKFQIPNRFVQNTHPRSRAGRHHTSNNYEYLIARVPASQWRNWRSEKQMNECEKFLLNGTSTPVDTT